jgi:hypothetical protein
VVEWEESMLKLESEKWAKQKAKIDLEYKFELLKKYKELGKMGYDDAAIKALIPEMSVVAAQVGGGNESGGNESDGSSYYNCSEQYK